MNKISGYFWWSQPRVAEEQEVAHIIKAKQIQETEAGTEGEVYQAYCGEEMLSWFYPGGSEPRFGIDEDVKKLNISICEICKRLKVY